MSIQDGILQENIEEGVMVLEGIPYSRAEEETQTMPVFWEVKGL